MSDFTHDQMLVLAHHQGDAAETANATGLATHHVNNLLRSAKLRKAILDRGFPVKRDPSMVLVPTKKAAKPLVATPRAASVPPVATGATMSVEEVIAALSAIGRDSEAGDRLKAIDLLQKIRVNAPDAESTDKEIAEKQRLAVLAQKRKERDAAIDLAYEISRTFQTRRYVALERCEFMGRVVEKGEEITIPQIKPDSRFFKASPATAEDVAPVVETTARRVAASSADKGFLTE
jgi:hypothetical protein